MNDKVMKNLGRVAALAGLLAAVWLVWHDNPRAVFALMRTAGAGLVLAGLLHVLPMLANAKDWQTLFLGAARPHMARMLHIVWIRESINSMLPVARIGGEIESFRLLRQDGVEAPEVVASLVVDMQLTLISQLMFALVGTGYLLSHAASGALRVAGELAWGIVALAPILALFALVQHANPFERITRLLNRATSGKLTALLGKSAQIDETIKLMWRRRGVVIRYLFLWQTLQNFATSLEIWAALHFLGSRVGLVEAFVIESLIQAVSIGPQAGLALAGARRIRDLLIFVPGLIAWQVAESSAKAPAGSAQGRHQGGS
jgi:putative membrane protein